MAFNVPPNNYDEYLKSIESFDNNQFHVATAFVGIGLISSVYTISAGIIPFFKRPIKPTK